MTSFNDGGTSGYSNVVIVPTPGMYTIGLDGNLNPFQSDILPIVTTGGHFGSKVIRQILPPVAVFYCIIC